MGVNQRVLYVSVAEKPHDMQDIFGFVVFHCGPPMPHRVEADFHYSRVSKLVSYSFSLFYKDKS